MMAARVAGLQAGDYLMTMTGALSNDNYEVLNGYPGLVTEVNTPTEWPVFFLNWQLHGMFCMIQPDRAPLCSWNTIGVFWVC